MTLRTKLLAAAGLAICLLAGAIGWRVLSGEPSDAPAAAPPAATATKPEPEKAADTSAPKAESGRKVWGADGGVEQILWEDLMPAGEEEKLTALYEDFYRDFEKQMRGNQVQLSDLGRKRNPDPSTIEEGSALDVMPQIGTFNTVADLNNLTIRIPAYVVPLEFNAQKSYREFLLVPYYGACLHTPPPPPNQIIYVKSDKAVTVTDIWQPVWAQGVLTTEKHEHTVGSAAYTLSLAKLEPYTN
jgi:uncharacterized protein